MKKPLFLILLLCLAVSLAACAGRNPSAPDPTTPDETAETAQSEETADATTSALPEKTEETETEGTEAEAPETETPEAETTVTEATETEETEPEKTEPEGTSLPDTSPAVLTLTEKKDYEGDTAELPRCSTTEDPTFEFVISTNKAVTEFRIISLFDPEVGEDGSLQFSFDTVYTQASLTPELPLLVQTAFYGDLPNIGVRYFDADGTEQIYAVDISGKDGSLLLNSIMLGGTA